MKRSTCIRGNQKGHGPGITSSHAYKAPPVFLDILALCACVLIVTGLVQLDIQLKWLMIYILLLILALIGSLIPTNITYLSRAGDVDSFYALRCPFRNHVYFPNCCVYGSLERYRLKCTFPSLSGHESLDFNQCCSKQSTLHQVLIVSLVILLLILSGDVEINPGPQVKPFTVEMVLEKLYGVTNLKHLGVWLNVPSSERDSLQSLINYFIEVHPFGSWRTVIWALDAIEEHDIADSIRGYAEISEDASFTVEKVTSIVMETTKGWYGGFADNIAVPWTIQDRIKADFPTLSEQKKALMEYWVKMLHDASWATLAGVLFLLEESIALQKCLVYLEKKQDSTLEIQILLELFEEVEDWDKLGYYLDVPWSIRAKIEKKNDSLNQRKTALLKEWLDNHPAPTWKLVGNALSWMGRRNVKLHTALKSIYPKYLPDPESKRLLTVLHRAVIEGGNLKQTVVQLHLSGTARSGKTSLIRRLIGKKARKTEPSTGVANKAVRVDIVKSSILVDDTKWRVVKDINEESSVILNGMRSSMSQHNNYPECSVYQPLPKDVPVTADPDIDILEVSQKQSDKRYRNISVNPVKIFEHAIQNAERGIRQTKHALSIYITDIGGQHEFQELIPALVSGPAVFLLVVPAHWGLNNTFPVEYIHQERNLQSSYQTNITLKEYVLQTLAAIMYIGNRKDTAYPKVVFVLTFMDMVTATELQAVDAELQEAVMATEAYNLNMLEFVGENQLCHYINNLSEDDTAVCKICKAIEHIGKQNDEYQVYTPYSWQFFGIALQSLDGDVLDYDVCLEVGKRCGIHTKGEVDMALSFFHEQTGIFRYYRDVPNLLDIVFKNPQVLFDMVSDLVINMFSFKQVGKHESEEFKKKGIFAIETLTKTIPDSALKLFSTSKFITFLTHHHIIAPLNRMTSQRLTYFFLPCVLKRASLKIQDCKSTSLQPLLVAFTAGYTPRGLFGFMVANLLNQQVKSDQLAMQLVQGQIFRNEITFSIGPYLDTIKFSSYSSHIQIDVTISSVKHTMPIGVICYLRERVKHILAQIIHQLHYNSNLKHSFAFICPHTSKTPVDNHPAIVTLFNDEPTALNCTLLNEAMELPKGYNIWFSKSESILVSDCPQDTVTQPRLAQLKLIRAPQGEKIEIIKSVSTTWKNVGVLMDFDPTGCQLELIEARHGHNDPEACCTALFEYWLLGNGRPVSWNTLIEMLEDADHSGLAKKVSQLLGFES